MAGALGGGGCLPGGLEQRPQFGEHFAPAGASHFGGGGLEGATDSAALVGVELVGGLEYGPDV